MITKIDGHFVQFAQKKRKSAYSFCAECAIFPPALRAGEKKEKRGGTNNLPPP